MTTENICKVCGSRLVGTEECYLCKTPVAPVDGDSKKEAAVWSENLK